MPGDTDKGDEPFMAIMQDPAKLKKWADKNEKSIRLYLGYVLAVFILFWFFSDGDWSFLLTLASFISCSSFIFVVVNIEAAQTCKGVSLKMMECYVFVTGARLVAILPFEGYLPFDRSGDWLYQLIEASAFCLAGTVVYLCRQAYPSTYDAAHDTMNHIYLIAGCFCVAVLFHPNLNENMPSDVCWVFALYLESLAGMPQLFLFQRSQEVRPWTAHFLAAQISAKVISFVFWASTIHELAMDARERCAALVCFMQLLQVVVFGDFMYHYIVCLQQGVSLDKMVLHGHDHV